MALDDQQLFERFRRAGDVAALGELFDRVAPALLRVALHMAHDPAAAEDLLQSTFLRAIEVRAEWDAQRPLLPWLCGILQNRARHHRWQGRRVPDPTRLAMPGPVDPAQAAEHAEFDAAVDASIAGLPEVYRPVLRLHLAYGHQPAEIAHALDRPPGTVRSQLARGLELLRKLLPAGFAGAVALTLASGRGIAAVKQVVVGHAVVAVPAVVAAAVLGGVAVMKKVVAVTVAVLAAGAWFAWPAPEAAMPPPLARPARSPPAGFDAQADAVSRVPVSAPPQTEPVADSQPREPARTQFDDEPHDLIEVGNILRLPIDAMLERLPLTDAARSACSAKELRRSVELTITAAGQRLDELLVIHSTIAFQAAERAFAEGRGRRTKPAAEEVASYSMVMGPDGKVWLSREDLPELFAIKDAMRRLATDLADELTRLASGPTSPNPRPR